MKINIIDKENIAQSYNEWKEYVSDSMQKTILTKEIPKIITKLKNNLNKLDDTFLGKHNYFVDAQYLKKKTKEIYKRSQEIINK